MKRGSALARLPGAAAMPRQAASDDQLLELWLYGRSAHTIRAYRADLQRFRTRAGKPFAAVTLGELQDFATTLDDLAPASRCRILSAVKSLLAFGHRIGYLPFDVGGALRLPAVRNRLAERILPEFDLHRMLSLEPDARNRAVLTLLYATGMRVGELCGLNWRDLQPNGETGQVTVFGKGGITRSIQLPAGVWKMLSTLRRAPARPVAGPAGPDDPPVGPDAPVFVSRKKKDGGRLRALAVLRIVRRAATRAGLEMPVSPHWLRHAHASHALDRGAPIHLVQATLGHASIGTTGRYLHARPKESSSRYLPL